MSDAEDKKIPEVSSPAAAGEAQGEGQDSTDELARERNAEPGPGARASTAAQVDDPASDTTPRPQPASPREQPENPNAATKATDTPAAEKSAAGSKTADAAAAKEAAKARAAARAAARPDAAARAGAARAGAARAGAAAKAEEAPPEPSPKQPWLDRLVAKIRERLGDGVVEEAAVNRLSEHRPTLTVNRERWPELARFLKEEPELAFVYLNDIVGVDYGKYFEVVYHLVSIAHREHLTVKVRTDREGASVPSVVSVWPGANWPEREAYDLLGIRFAGHPDLRRIMLPENWVGHPLRKDYEQYDETM